MGRELEGRLGLLPEEPWAKGLGSGVEMGSYSSGQFLRFCQQGSEMSLVGRGTEGRR